MLGQIRGLVLHIDLETRSDIDLQKQGLFNYIKSPHTEILCAAYAFDDEEPKIVPYGKDLPNIVLDHIEDRGQVWAHNAAFEREMLNRQYENLIRNEYTVCTMAMSYAMGLPGHLAGSAAALGVSQQKDDAGRRLMLQLCQPKKIHPDGRIDWWEEPSQLERLYEYCKQDVRVEREIGKRMMKLSPYERKVWFLDQKINSKGISVDISGTTAAITLVQSEKDRLNEEIQKISGGAIATCNVVAQIKQYLARFGVIDKDDSLAKEDVHSLLDDLSLPLHVRKVLELRREAAKASTAKLSAIKNRVSGDARLRGLFQFSGAGTRRWAGRGVQFQNLPRSKIDPALIEKILNELPDGLTPEFISSVVGSPLDVISSCLRGLFLAPQGKEFLVQDFSAIEARVIAWLAGQNSVLKIFREDLDVYVFAAAAIFNKDPSRISGGERQVGKVAVLALGYQGGVGALQKMCKAYGVRLFPAYCALRDRASTEQFQFADDRWNQVGKDYPGISIEEFIASDLVKAFWRAENQDIVQYWRELESAALNAVMSPKLTFKTSMGNVKFKMNGSFLWCQLPSGGVMCYPYPKIESAKMPWGDTRKVLTYMAEDSQSHKWMRFKTYGGSLAENVTQAVSRDLLADAMLRLDSVGFNIVAHVHDEIICEETIQLGSDRLDYMRAVMENNPIWAQTLPIKCSGYRAKRYRKQ